MNWNRYTWPSWIFPAAARSSTFHTTSAPYPSFVIEAKPPGGASGTPPQLLLVRAFLGGSTSGKVVTTGGEDNLYVLTAPFHVPATLFGDMAVLDPCCQSPLLRF